MPDPLLRTDEELVEDFLGGDATSFRHLIERYHDPLLRFLFRLTGRREMAEDVFQDTFLQVHQSLGSFDVTRRFKPWVFTIAANKARDAMRRAQRRAAVSISPRDDESSGPIDLADLRIASPDSRLGASEQAAMVQKAIDQMPARLREILLLAYFQRLTYQQIAEQFEIPVGTVKSRLHAAVAAFADLWKRASAESEAKNAAGNARSGEQP
jgi:RNA polymerase sigma-70 factor, ECF subfamily